MKKFLEVSYLIENEIFQCRAKRFQNDFSDVFIQKQREIILLKLIGQDVYYRKRQIRYPQINMYGCDKIYNLKQQTEQELAELNQKIEELIIYRIRYKENLRTKKKKKQLQKLGMINIDKKVSEGKIDFNLNIDKQKQDIVQIKLLNRPDKIDNQDKFFQHDNQIEGNTQQQINQTTNNQITSNTLQNQIKNNQTLNQVSNQQQIPSLQTKLKKNKFLYQIFKHFCNMTYANTRKKTFQEMSKTIYHMSLNRFMLFSKQFNIYRIIKADIDSQPKRFSLKQNQKLKTQTTPMKQTFNLQKHQKTSPKPVMLEIPVKNINNTQKTLTKLYKQNTNKHQKMTYQEFLNVLLQIYQIFQRNFNHFYKEQKYSEKNQIEEKFLQDFLIIGDAKRFEDKMSNLKIQFKGAISYHQEPTHKSTSFLNRNLVIHGGRSPDQMKKELQIYQASKIERKQSWIEKQPQTMGTYSKSRVFYRPNPSKIYQTNDVIRLARKQAGRTLTESLFDYSTLKSQKRQMILRRQEGVDLSQIFEDKTNKFNQKLQKMKQQLLVKDKQYKKRKQSKQIDRDDEILQKYFENEKKIYGDEKIIMGIDR